MCAIIGFVCPEPSKEAIDTLKQLFIESKIRGMHAYGYAAIQDGTVIEYKSNTLKPLLDSIRTPTMLIGHCRYSTSGDYRNHLNNQPLRHGDEWLVFNGVIDMRTKAEMQAAHRIEMSSDNDGEIMLQAKDRMKLLKSKVTFSGLTLNSHRLAFFRNEGRPGYRGDRYGATFIGSTADILRRCRMEPAQMNPYEVHEWTA
jgi:glutamine phosphoribosylpyrophosphate amidotransferase